MPVVNREFVSRQFMCCGSLKECDWKIIFKSLTWDEQLAFLLESVKCPLVERLPVKKTYQATFLKEVIDYLERENIEVHDEFYEAYCDLLNSSKNGDEFSYKHYVISADTVVSLKESSNLISDGTTGLRTWEASLVLSEWCLQNKNELENKYVLELGSGAGLASLVVGKCCRPKQIWLTDCHPGVLRLLRENVSLNFQNDLKFKTNENDDRVQLKCHLNKSELEIGIMNLPWEDLAADDFLKQIVIPDIILAADVVYDSTVFQPLCDAFQYFLRNNTKCKVYLVCTVRNPQTLEDFLELLESQSLEVRNETIPEQTHLYWLHSITMRIFSISGNITLSKKHAV